VKQVLYLRPRSVTYHHTKYGQPDDLETQNFHTLGFRCLADIYEEKFNPFDLSVFPMKIEFTGLRSHKG